MNDDVRRYLDGEAAMESLSDEARNEAERWERLLDTVRMARPREEAPSWLEDRVMAEIHAVPEHGGLARAWEWLLRPQSVRVSPLVGVMAAAAVAMVFLLPAVQTPAGGPAVSSDAVVYVQFLLEAPAARTVAVGGDFDEWKGSYTLADPDGDGVWAGRIPLQPGLHSYMFLIDGSTWVTDPEAGRYSDDGFGNRNAILAVAEPVT